MDIRVTFPDEAIARVTALVTAREGTRWVGIDGLGAAGKSTFADRLVAALPGAVVVRIDDFARPGLRGWDRDRFARQLLEPLLTGRAARYQRWDFATDTPSEWLRVEPGGVVVVEGVSATDVRVGVPWDVTLWLDVDADERWRRVLARDGEALRDRWLTDWIPSEEDYVRFQQPQQRVDLVVRGT